MPRPGHDAVLLVTGFPSLYARRMVRHVLGAEPHALVYAVVPESRQERAQAEIDALDTADRGRVALVEGDPQRMDLGLSGAEFRKLTREVDRIHHMSHVQQSAAPAREAYAENVVGAAEILEFARAAHAAGALECLVVHSTALV